MILSHIKNIIADNNLQWKRPSQVTDTFVEFRNDNKIINFEQYENGEIDCYLNTGGDRWQYTNKQANFADMWRKFSVRYLPDVIDKMLEIVPEDNDSLIAALEAIKVSGSVAAPEMAYVFWRECLNAIIVYESADWFESVIEVFVGVG